MRPSPKHLVEVTTRRNKKYRAGRANEREREREREREKTERGKLRKHARFQAEEALKRERK